MRAANFQGEKKLRASLFHFGHKTCVGYRGTWKDRASFVQAMAAARKTEKIVCDLLSWGLVAEDALGSCRLAPSWGGGGGGIKVLAWKKKSMA